MKSALLKLKSFWFSPAPAERLAILRVATGGFSLWYLVTRYEMIQRMAQSDIALFEPVGLSNLLPGPIPPTLFTVLYSTGIALNIAYMIGLKFKWTGPLFALLLLFLLSYRNSWSMIYHNRIALVLHVLVIGFVSAADAYSFDAWWKNRKGMIKSAMSHWRYGWPIRLVCAATVLTYFMAGLAKVFGDLAWDWVSGNAMRSQVAVDALRKTVLGETHSPLFEWLYPHTTLFLLMGVLTFVLELGGPLILGHKRAGMIWAVLTWSMHWGIFFIMGIRFRYQMSGIIFLPFFETEKAIPYLRKLFGKRQRSSELAMRPTESPSIVLFDGVCNFCNKTVRFILDNDYNQRFQFASQQSATGMALLTKFNAPKDNSTIILIEKDRVYSRSTAVLRIMRRLRSPWSWLYVFMLIPKPLREAGYQLFARHRYRWFGMQDVCEIPEPHIQSRFL
ncbi:DCC1-like thiol-disulfide oxidoreductase family protein [Fulvivirgaceae bacterium BMA12]|uniref:DCC1-like thiol-disulfide oxidoreductase family protein n=1 Tax=Agaribacillus aureus TaxID=3051825 RepID=A0ABT8L0Z2_9BACT|nr:DCC1-like thiol-disulfide oxidoreductase family protein [Fulvivirgaceae bacterium BMA12]